jgi:hypothetical protein
MPAGRTCARTLNVDQPAMQMQMGSGPGWWRDSPWPRGRTHVGLEGGLVAGVAITLMSPPYVESSYVEGFCGVPSAC